MGWDSYIDWRPYVPVEQRRRRAAQQIVRMKKEGRAILPVKITGRKIAMTFWGDAWCKNLERYSDYANRLPRGRTYVRNGSVIDLHIEPAKVHSLVSGSEIYEVDIQIKRLAKKRWADIKARCAGKIESLIELLQGSISAGVMKLVTSKSDGLFPATREISVSCSCPDWADMCKHVAATLYGVGARFDHAPELLFTLRGVDPAEMVEVAVSQPARRATPGRRKVLKPAELSSVFGIEIDRGGSNTEDNKVPRQSERRMGARKKKAAVKSAAVKRKPKASKTTSRKATKKPAARKMASKKPTTRKANAARNGPRPKKKK